LDFQTAKARAEELRGILRYHSDLYYNQDKPQISDYEYDMLNNELKRIEAEYPELITADSPTQIVGGKASKLFEKVTHAVKMESLQDVFSLEEVTAFIEKIKADFPDAAFTVEPKIDGLSVSLEYENGTFVRGSTRGDGVVGEDVTANLMQIKDIPHKIKSDVVRLEVRGEVYMPHESFFACIQKQEEAGEDAMTWKCPKCGREFSRQNQDHYCVKPQNIDEYIAVQDEKIQPRLREIRAVLQSALPEAEERISWSMPTYWKGRNIIHFAASKKHLGLYPGDEAVTAFSNELTDFDVSKGTIRLPYDRPLPEELVKKIAGWCYKKYAKRRITYTVSKTKILLVKTF